MVIPKAIRDRHGFGDGQSVEIVDTPAGVLIRSPAASLDALTMDEVVSRLGSRICYDGPIVPIEEMNLAIEEMFRGELEKGR